MYRVYFENNEKKLFVNGKEIKGRRTYLVEDSDIEIKDYAAGIIYSGYFIKAGAKLLSRDVALVDYGGEYGELVIKSDDRKVASNFKALEQRMVDSETLFTYYYDGNYHVVLEDSEYIVKKCAADMNDVEIDADGGIYTLRYTSNGKKALTLYKKDPDFETLVDVIGDSVDFSGDTVSVAEKLKDTLGREKRSVYTKDNSGRYAESVEFVYRYRNEYPSDMMCELIRDALYAGDYRYIADKMYEETDESALKEYFVEIHCGSLVKLSFAPLLSDGIITAYKENNEIKTKKIAIEFDGDMKILNFEERGI